MGGDIAKTGYGTGYEMGDQSMTSCSDAAFRPYFRFNV
jgi:hypothetical protein